VPVSSRGTRGTTVSWLHTAARFLTDTTTRFQSGRCPLMAAGLAYYVLISVSPVLVVAVGVVAMIVRRDGVQRELFGRIGEALGSDIANVAQRAFNDPRLFSSMTVPSFIALAVLVYGSTRAFTELQIAFDVIWDTPRSSTIAVSAWHAVRSRLVAFLMVLGTAGVILVGMTLETLGDTLHAVLASHSPEWIPLSVGHRTLAWLLRFGSLSAVYYWLPKQRVAWRAVWPSSALVTTALSVGHTLIGVYVDHGIAESAYGAAGSVIALLFSFYFVAYTVLVGAQLTQVLTTSTR